MATLNFEPIALTPNLYQLGTPFFPVYLSVGKKAMIIEGGTSATFDIIISQLAALKIDPQQIEFVALTHSHADHIGAYPRLRARWPHVKIIAGAAASKTMGNGGMIKQFHWLDQTIAELMQSRQAIVELPAPMDEWHFEVDVIVKEGDVIDLGQGTKWMVYETPGHSPCQLAFLEKNSGMMAIGDATGFYNPDRNAIWPNYFDGLDPYCDSIKKLAGLGAKGLVLSHNGFCPDANAFLAKALRITGEYHQEMLERAGNGDDPAGIIAEKSKWVKEIADQMPLKIIQQLTGLLIKLSQKAGPRPEGYFIP
ncbi:MAG: MBL fold metallo-hydrolase [Desulfatitalea sp.]|nr:MBL fold metallo-hydrolase [Desulfatitalea sp.]NNK02005.1 MBL fold metallo-hydrolase [Desulfatitalea sp.]